MTAGKKRHGKHGWQTARRFGSAARRTARKWAAVTAMAPVLLLPATLAGASSSFQAGPLKPTGQHPDPRQLGVTGQLPRNPQLSPELLNRAADPGQLATGAGPQVALPRGPLGIPKPVLAAYVRAADLVDKADRGCGLHWSVLASIGRIESEHARSGSVDVVGTTVRAILGPRLSGGPDVAAISDTDGGRFDGDPVWDRAVGPMQFIPSTWRMFAVDGNEDGVASPHNIHDASVAAGQYLCGGGGDLRDPRDLAAAVFNYNHSDSYVRTVLIWAAAYAKGVTPTPSELSPAVDDVLAGERLPNGPAVLALPPAAPPPAPVPTPQPARPAPAGPPPAPSRPAPPISVDPPTIPQPTPPDVAPPELTTPPSPIPPETPPNSTAPGSTTQPGTPPPATSAPPGASQPGIPPEPSQPGAPPPGTSAPPPAPGGTVPPSESLVPPAPPSDPIPSNACDPGVLTSGEFATAEQPPGTSLEPGAADPAAAVPGQVVFVETGTAGALGPCTVPADYRPL
ncbi:lytic transglycosylase domain-containing protein [Saccharopolyspora soli]|uniref:lytic transglycosylase domain-containing protein n=1 Tax=Saccharopolyspora soli TaxID=2926618 RepID=UPI0027DF2067|nr:lytic murein transglycosylase [Saccharopolyspora soli]